MNKRLFFWLAGFFAVALVTGASIAAQCCIAPDNGTGTVGLPPENCAYASSEQALVLTTPDGTGEAHSDYHVDSFFDITYRIGGSLGGEIQQFGAALSLNLQGRGSLADFRRSIAMPVFAETHTGPRNPGEPVQS